MDDETPRPLASRRAVAQYLGVPVSTLERWHRLGTGPVHRRIGRHARYRWSDVEQWVDRQEDAGIGGGAA